MKRILRLIGFVALTSAITGGLLIFGCVKKSIEPPPPEPEEHFFYVSARPDNDSSVVKIFSVEQRAFVDSFTVDSFRIWNFDVQGNDERLFLAGPGLRVYDIKSKELLYTTTDYCCDVEISNNSTYYKPLSSGTKLYRTNDYQEIYYDSNGAGSGHFSHDSRYFMYNRFDSVVAYDIIGDSIENSVGLTWNGSLFRAYKIWPTVDMKKLFLIGNQGWLLYLAVTDFGKDSVRILQAPLRTGGEDGAMSPDGKYFYFINTPYMDSEMPRLKIDVYDVHTEQLITSISTREYNFYEPQRISLSSDGKYIMVTPRIWDGCDVLLIDAQNYSVIGSYQFGYQIVPEEVCTKH
jgi:hypothetical protein